MARRLARIPGLPGFPASSNQSTGNSATPQNTLYVSPNFYNGNSTVSVKPPFFTVLGDALLYAKTLSDSVEIIIYPGTYSETLTYTGDVQLTGLGEIYYRIANLGEQFGKGINSFWINGK